MTPIEVECGIWVDHHDRAPASGHPDDLRATRDGPAWRRAQRLGARGLLRRLLDRVVPAAAGAEIETCPGGRPRLKGWPQIGISLSHDEGLAAVAVAIGRHVGVDVQTPPRDLSEGLVRRCLRERAPAVLSLDAEARATEFAWIWSVQEACVKCEGSGLAGRPWCIDVPAGAAAGRWRDVTWRMLRRHTAIPISCAFGEPRC